jgi:protein-tyrosine kinase
MSGSTRSPSRFSSLDFDLSKDETPVLNHPLKDEREGLVVRSMQAINERESDNIRDVRLKLPLQARLEPTLGSGQSHDDIPIQAQRDVQLGHAKLVPSAFAAEQYEVLKAKLWTRYSEKDMKVVLFVGATLGSGATTTASNFAAMLAQDAQAKVLLIDANLRVKKTFGRGRQRDNQNESDVSLAGLLAADSSTVYPVPGPGNLYVLPSGTQCAAPLSLFQSESFDQFLQTVRKRFDHVVIDAPPLSGFPESIVLSRKADGVILVVEAGRTRRRAGLWAKQQIEDAGGKILGVVLNKRKFHIPNWLYRHI